MNTRHNELPPPGPLLLYMVKQVELVSRSRLDAILKDSGVTALQFTALSVLERTPAMSSADLARASFVRAQSTADLISALERRGLIERHVDPGNRRRLVIKLTAEGRAFLAEYDPQVARLEDEMLAGLGDAERTALRDYLTACRQNLTDRP